MEEGDPLRMSSTEIVDPAMADFINETLLLASDENMMQLEVALEDLPPVNAANQERGAPEVIPVDTNAVLATTAAISATPDSRNVPGKNIASLFPHDCHFLTSCANFEPLDKGFFQSVCERHLRDMYSNDPRSLEWANGVKIGVRPLIFPEEKHRSSIPQGLMEVLHARAQQIKQNPNARFRIWKAPKKLKQDEWEDAIFEDVTENQEKAKKTLEGTIKGYREKIVGGGDAPSSTYDETSTTIAALSEEQNDDNDLDDSQGQKRSRAETGAAIPAPAVDVASSSPSSHGMSPEQLLEEAKRIVELEFVARYKRRVFKKALERLYADFDEKGNNSYQEWAKQLYCFFRQNQTDEQASKLNDDRGDCLELVYDLVNQWDKFCKTYRVSEPFEEAMWDSLQRIENILTICLPMDRAQALYKLYDRTKPSGPKGQPWYCKLHGLNDEDYNKMYCCETHNPFAHNYSQVKDNFYEYLEQYKIGPKKPSMNKRLFRLLFCRRLNLLEKDHFRELAMPARRPSDADE